MKNRVYAGPSLARQLALCATAVEGVCAGRSLTDLLADVPPDLRPGVQALSFHALRWLGAAMALREHLAPRRPPADVEALLLTSLALLWPASAPPYPPHTLVDQAVAAARRCHPSAAGFVNAVLRRFLRESEALSLAVGADERARWNHPPWWILRLREDWPQHADALLVAAQTRAPLVLRVNARRCTAAAYLERLVAVGKHGRVAPPGLGLDELVQMDEACPVQDLPGFAQGDVSVQDTNAQRAASLLLGHAGLPPRARVLDACAAPGGKTAHLLERADLDLLALDRDPQRLDRVAEALQRLHLHAQLVAGDASQPETWWDQRPFDAILVDAPCSASGIVRRHPDIRWLRKPGDVAALARQQAALLDALWPLLKPGGRLLYATCSVFKAEGAHQIDAFLQRLPAGTVQLAPEAPGHLLPLPENAATPLSSQMLPPGDGFFYALLVKR